MNANFFKVEPIVQFSQGYYESGSLVQGKLFFEPNLEIKNLKISFAGLEEFKSKGMKKSETKELFNESKTYKLEGKTGLSCIELNNIIPSKAFSSAEYHDGTSSISIAYFYKLDFDFSEDKTQVSFFKPFIVRGEHTKGKYPITSNAELNISLFCGHKGDCKIEVTNKKEFYEWEDNVSLDLLVDNTGSSVPTQSLISSLIMKVTCKSDSKGSKGDFTTVKIEETQTPFVCIENKQKKAHIVLGLSKANSKLDYSKVDSTKIYGTDPQAILDRMSSVFKSNFLIEFFAEVVVVWEGNACTDNELKVSLPVLVYSKSMIEATKVFEDSSRSVNIAYEEPITVLLESAPEEASTFYEMHPQRSAEPESNFQQGLLEDKVDEEKILEFEPQPVVEELSCAIEVSPEVEKVPDIAVEPVSKEIPHECTLKDGTMTKNNGKVIETDHNITVTYKNDYIPVYIRGCTPNNGIIIESSNNMVVTYKTFNEFGTTKNKGKFIETQERIVITYKLTDV